MTRISKLQVGGRPYEVKYETSRSFSSNVRIKNGTVVLKLSRFLQGRKRDETIENFLKWADKRLAKARPDDFVLPDYRDGGRVWTHNKVYEISVSFEDRKNSRAFLRDGGFIDLRFPFEFEVRGRSSGSGDELREKIKYSAEGVIIKDQTPYLKEVLEELNQLYFCQKYNSCRFKRTTTRFGSCSSKGNINISYRLLFAPREVFRYVCAHELAHLTEFNHSKKFWDLVAKAVPDYKNHEKWLREKGFLLG